MKRNRKKIPNVTLCAMTSVKVHETVQALMYSMRELEFEKCVLITHQKPFMLPKEIEYRHIDRLNNIDAFNYNMLFELHKYIDTDYALIVHFDGYVVNPQSWKNEFLDYDYIGAPWPLPKDEQSYRDINGNICRVGNSVSIRSKKLLELPEKIGISWEDWDGEKNEDTFICCTHRHLFEENGISIAPLEIAKYFSHETMIPEIEGIEPFVFHKWAGTNAKYPYFKPRIWTRLKKKIKKALK